MVDYDLIVIGCGPGGMNACLYATRSNLKTLVIEKNCPGGKMIKANSIENWMGINKISGVDLSLQMFKHSFSYGGVYEQGNVLEVLDQGNYKEVVLKDKTYKCYAVVIATGTSEKKMGIPGEEKYYGKGVSYCAICDGTLYKGKDMVVIGNSAHAIEETLYLAKIAKKVYLINDKDNFDADKNLINQIVNNNNIEIKYNTVPLCIKGDKCVNEIIIKGDKEESISTSIVFPLIGDNPDTRFTERLKVTNENNYIEVNSSKETQIKGIYAIGDCTNTKLKQIITACSDGAIAAIEAYKYIKNIK